MKRNKKAINSGDRFGRLTIIEELQKKNHNRQFLCKCDCGTEKIVDSSKLLSGNTKSCGCLKKELVTKKNTIHGLSKHPLFHVWTSMKGRCFNPNDQAYENYGLRGISVCKEWMEFEPFYDWAIKNSYSKGLTIERVDVNSNYEPSNCEWIPRAEQSKNRRSNWFIEFDGQIKTISQWARDIGLSRESLRDRINNGWKIEEALTFPPGSKRKTKTEAI